MMLRIKFTPKKADEYRKEIYAAVPKKVRASMSKGEWETLQSRIARYLEVGGAADLTGESVFGRTKKKKKGEEKERKEKTIGDHLFESYEGGSEACDELKSRPKQYPRKQLEGHCPYCGTLLAVYAPKQSPDRDHFLPRSVYPEFSLLAANLVSSCGPCNNVKRAHHLTATGRAMFLHPYFATELSKPLVSASILNPGGDPVAEFTVDATVSVANSHFDALKLENRWREYAGLGFGKCIRGYQTTLARDGNLSGARQDMQTEVERYRERGQPNSPDAVLLRAMLALTDKDLGALLEQSEPFKNAANAPGLVEADDSKDSKGAPDV